MTREAAIIDRANKAADAAVAAVKDLVINKDAKKLAAASTAAATIFSYSGGNPRLSAEASIVIASELVLGDQDFHHNEAKSKALALHANPYHVEYALGAAIRAVRGVEKAST